MSDHSNSVAGLQEVKVDQRALVNMLARYPGTFDVLRELIQNADDADARNIEIHFQTKKAEGSQPASKPDVTKLKVRKWIIKDNGNGFEDTDWERLGKIAAGNVNPTKVGAFGVGFYSVLGMSDRPLVRSNGKSLQFFRGRDGKLRKPDEPKADDSPDSRTSIELELRDPESLPVFVDLARFLVSSVAFLTNIDTISVHLDTERVLCIQRKEVQPPATIPIPQHLNPTTPLKTLTVESVQRAVQRIAVNAAEWAFPASPTSSLPEDDTGDTLVERRSEEHRPTHTSPSVSAILENNAIMHDLYTVTVCVNLGKDSMMKRGVESCMKSLPPSFKCKAVYFNSEQYDSLASVNNLDSPEAKYLARFFCGSQGIFPKNDSGRLFIGQSTNQTTGIGLHISGHFLPTMERGAIDLANGQVKVWNEQVLHVGGFLARVIYEEEMNTAKSKSRLATQLGLRTMGRFAFGPTVPNGGVSQLLQEAFFSCCHEANSPLPVVSDVGISCVLKDQFRRNSLPFLKRYRVLHEGINQRPEIIRRYNIPPLLLDDIVPDFELGTTQDTMTLFFRWWDSFRKNPLPKNTQNKFCTEFSSRAVLSLSHGVNVPLKGIKYFTFFPLPNGLSHPNNIYVDVMQRVPSRDTVKCFGWAQLSLLDWLGDVCSRAPQLTSSGDSGRDSDVGFRILRALVRFALVEDLSPDQWHEAAKLMKDLKCIPITDNRRELPADSYFDVADVCRSLPVAQEKDCLETSMTPVATQMGFDFKTMNPEHVRKVLASIHVRKIMTPEAWEDMVGRLERNASKETNHRLLRYLATILREKLVDWEQLNQLLDSLKGRRIFYSDNHDQQPANELLLPTEGVPELGLPTLALPHDASLQSVIDQFGTIIDTLGIQRYPSLDRIISRAASDEPKVQGPALQYLLSNLEIHYKDYKSDSFAEVAFIPTKCGSLACPNEVFTSVAWEKLGFKQVPDDLRRRLSRLGVKEDPPIDVITEHLRTPERTLPDLKTAATWFEQLHLHGKFPAPKLLELSTIRFVPVKNPGPATSESSSIQYICPKDCFIMSTEMKQHHRAIFTFLDFGQDGNKFLDSCCAKKSPGASDIVCKIVENPKNYLKALGDNTKLYLDDLRTIASQLDSIPEKDKQAMKKAPMFPAERNGVPTRELFTAEKVLFRDWESRDFGSDVSVAPKDKVLEKLYREMGSAYLGTYVRHDVITVGDTLDDNPPFTRGQVIQRIDRFMDKREKSGKTDVSFDDLGVGSCKSITLEKTFTPPDGILPSVTTKIKPVKAGSKLNEDGKSYTLWMVGDSAISHPAALRNDIAVALCHILLKTYGPNDVLLLASLFRMSDEILENYYDVGGKSKLRSPDAKETPPNESKKKMELKVLLPAWLAKVVRAPKAKIEVTIHEQAIEGDMKRAIASWGTSGLNDEAPDPSAPGQQPSTSPKKYKTYCQLAHTIKLLEKQHLQDKETQIRFFLTKDAQCQQPPQLALEEFAKLISHLARVFGQENPSQACYIFWQDNINDDNLMAFNRDQKYIFLNLAHYHKFFCVKRVERKEMITEWYLIMAHEIAHNLTMEHDEYHGSLSASLATKYLPALYAEFPDIAWENQ